MKIGITSFAATRHTTESENSHFDGTDRELETRILESWEDRKPGHIEGTFIVPVNPDGFWSGIVVVPEGAKLLTVFEPRRPGELPYKKTYADVPKQRAKYAEIVVYSAEVLRSENALTNESSAYEVVSVNARVTEEEEPPTPETMKRNALEQEGGTKACYPADEILWSIEYWRDKAHVMPAHLKG